MVREGPAEPAPPHAAETPEASRTKPYGMLVGAAAVTIALVILLELLLR